MTEHSNEGASVNRLSAFLTGGAIVLAATSAVLGGVYLSQTPPPPTPTTRLGAIPAAGLAGAPLPEPTRVAAAPAPYTLARSMPVSLTVPAIGVHTQLIGLGLTSTGAIQVPPLTLAGVREAGWYRLGPTPGSLGPAIIVGHVDSYQAAGVFYELGTLRPGEMIDVGLADHVTAAFRINAVASYAKTAFPTESVYGPIDYAGLRLITCGGAFDTTTRSYLSNIVVYATLAPPATRAPAAGVATRAPATAGVATRRPGLATAAPTLG